MSMHTGGGRCDSAGRIPLKVILRGNHREVGIPLGGDRCRPLRRRV